MFVGQWPTALYVRYGAVAWRFFSFFFTIVGVAQARPLYFFAPLYFPVVWGAEEKDPLSLLLLLFSPFQKPRPPLQYCNEIVEARTTSLPPGSAMDFIEQSVHSCKGNTRYLCKICQSCWFRLLLCWCTGISFLFSKNASFLALLWHSAPVAGDNSFPLPTWPFFPLGGGEGRKGGGGRRKKDFFPFLSRHRVQYKDAGGGKSIFFCLILYPKLGLFFLVWRGPKRDFSFKTVCPSSPNLVQMFPLQASKQARDRSHHFSSSFDRSRKGGEWEVKDCLLYSRLRLPTIYTSKMERKNRIGGTFSFCSLYVSLLRLWGKESLFDPWRPEIWTWVPTPNRTFEPDK